MNVIDPNMRMIEVEYDPFASSVVRSFPTTDAQREIWLATELGSEASLAYNESVSLIMRGALNVPALQDALNALVARHEALRATFDSEGATMLIASDVAVGIDVIDLASADQTARDSRLAEIRNEAVQTPFDLTNGPLLRAVLVRTAPDAHEFILTAHHIVVDGWSCGIISRDLMSLYKLTSIAQPASLSAPDSFGDYAMSMHDPEQVRATEADEQYWVGVFDRRQPVLDLPTDQARGRQRSFASRRIDHLLPPKLVDAARQLGAKNGVSLFATLFGIFAAMLERLGGEGEVVLGVPAAGQSTRGLDALVGHCVNVLPVRVTADRKEPVATLLKHAGGRILDAYDHQNCTFGQLLTKLNVPREANRLPLVSVLFNIDAPISPEMLSLDGLDVSLRSIPRVAENF
nr:condensation domain-containing protein [Hyphomicrobium sp.]